MRESTRPDTQPSRRGSAANGRWCGASDGRPGGAGPNGGGYRSSLNSNNMTNQGSFDRSSSVRSGDDITSWANSTNSRVSVVRAVLQGQKTAGFNHLNSLDADPGAD